MKNVLINIGLSVLSGVLLILSTAGFGLSFLVFIAFVPLLLAVRRGGLSPLISGWITGFLYWVVCLSWMTVTFGHFGGAPAVAAVALLLGVAVSGGFLFFAPFAYIARRYESPPLLAMVFVALEAAKSSLFFGGVPWLNLAQSQYENILILSFVSFFGEYGLSFIIMVINVLIFKLIFNQNRRIPAVFLAATILLILVPGVFRALKPYEYDALKRVKIIQTGYKQEDKWRQDKRFIIINDLNRRLMAEDRKKYDLIVLPESSYPARILDTPFIMDVLNDISFDTPILAGTDREEVLDGRTAYYNSMIMIDGGEAVIYDKRHLAPFGEYFPFENLLRPVKEFFFGPGAMFTPGTNPVVFETGGMKIAPLICFEGAFSSLLKEPIAGGANVIAVISNDSWFGRSQGRLQHLAVDAVRAAEYGRATLRATQDGITAVIMPDGSIPARISEPVAGEIDWEVPLVSERTLYSYGGNLWIAFIIPLVYYLERRRKKRL